MARCIVETTCARVLSFPPKRSVKSLVVTTAIRIVRSTDCVWKTLRCALLSIVERIAKWFSCVLQRNSIFSISLLRWYTLCFVPLRLVGCIKVYFIFSSKITDKPEGDQVKLTDLAGLDTDTPEYVSISGYFCANLSERIFVFVTSKDSIFPSALGI